MLSKKNNFILQVEKKRQNFNELFPPLKSYHSAY